VDLRAFVFIEIIQIINTTGIVSAINMHCNG
jgi:hypothetical protein